MTPRCEICGYPEAKPGVFGYEDIVLCTLCSEAAEVVAREFWEEEMKHEVLAGVSVWG